MTYNKSKKHIYTALLSLVILSLAIIAISMSPMTVNAQLYQLYNPTNVQGTNSQSVLNAQLKNELIARYGSVYYSCVASVPPPVAGGMNQYTYGGYLNIIQQQLALGNNPACRAPCPSGYLSVNKQCVTPNQGCVMLKGPNSEMQSHDPVANTLSCRCISGYSWDEGQVACIAKQVPKIIPTPMSLKTNDQVCTDLFGRNIVWSGDFYDTGGPKCRCVLGFTWNGTACIAETSKITPTPILSTPSTPNPIRITPTPKKTQNQKPIITDEPIASIPVTNVDNYSKSIEIASGRKGVVSRVWSWFTGLLGY